MLSLWGYLEKNGPSTWGEQFPIGTEGLRQSPIDICTEKCLKTKDFGLVKGDYKSGKFLQLSNTGAAWKVQASPEMAKNSCLKGGPLKYEYKLEQFHCHWGKDEKSGSEHTVDGQFYAAELHFVHWNCELYSSFAEAADKDHGLAVVGVFVELGENNPELAKISSLMNMISYFGQSTQITSELSIDKLLPDDRKFWTYEGSLTTPPLYESVTWIVLKKPITASADQINRFRMMHFIRADQDMDGETKIVENYRPTQPLSGRSVKFVDGSSD